MKDEPETLQDLQQKTYMTIFLVGLVGDVLALVMNALLGSISSFTLGLFLVTVAFIASQILLLRSGRVRVALVQEMVYVGISLVLLAAFFYALYLHPPESLRWVSLVSLFLWFPFIYVFIFIAYEGRGALARSGLTYLLTLCVSLPHAVATLGSGDAFEGFYSLGQFYATSASLIAVLFFFTKMREQLRETQAVADRMSMLAQTDALTGIPNRRRIEAILEQETQRASRYGSPLSLIAFDLDHFKQLNDTLGHDAGDKVLIEVARLVQPCLRASDRFGRWGGEEFTVVTTETSFAPARQLADRIRTTIESHDFGFGSGLSASFGVAEHQPGDSVATLIKRADLALYRAKSLGRNRVESISA